MHAVDGKGVADEPVEEFERPGKGTEDIDGILYGWLGIQVVHEVDVEWRRQEGLGEADGEVGEGDGEVARVVEVTGVS